MVTVRGAARRAQGRARRRRRGATARCASRMPLVSTPAIVLATLRYGETSKIVRLATREQGIQSAIAKGALRPRSRYGAALQVLSEGAAQYLAKEGRELHTLTAVRRHSPAGGSRRAARPLLGGVRHVGSDAAAGAGRAACGELRRHGACARRCSRRSRRRPWRATGSGRSGSWCRHSGFAPALAACARDGVGASRERHRAVQPHRWRRPLQLVRARARHASSCRARRSTTSPRSCLPTPTCRSSTPGISPPTGACSRAGCAPISPRRRNCPHSSHGSSATGPEMIIGMAGHVDHGKSALVTALTGRPMDRLAEERQRGITIELELRAAGARPGRHGRASSTCRGTRTSCAPWLPVPPASTWRSW